MSLLDLVDEKRPEILRIAAKHGARDVRLFGSVARGEDHEGSDVDLLAEVSGFDRQDALSEELRELLGVKVDVLSYPHPYMRDRVYGEAIPLAAANFRELAVIESQRPHKLLDRDSMHLRLMLDAVEAVLEYSVGGRAAFDAVRMRRDATIWQLVNIGEEANKVSAEFQTQHDGIPWAKIIAFRNFAVHNYQGLDMDQVWNHVTMSVPGLKAELEKLL